MKKFLDILFSLPTTGFLFLVFAISLAIATFVENSYGSEAARAIVYNSWWLELVLILLGINLIANVFIFKLYKKQKLTLGIFHLAFILILLGAGTTRYFGKEGEMHIREGASSSSMITQEPYFQFKAEAGKEKKEIAISFLASSLSKNQINEKIHLAGKVIKIKSVDYLHQAQKSVEKDNNGIPVAEIVYPSGNTMQSLILKSGETEKINNVTLGFNTDGAIIFSNSGDTLRMTSRDTISTVDMSGGKGLSFIPGQQVICNVKIVYKAGNATFLIKQFLSSAKVTVAQAEEGQQGQGAVIIQVSDDSNSKLFTAWVENENQSSRQEETFEGIKFSTWVGPRETILPFSIRLKKFVLERYPGSNSPSSYESLVTLTDREHGVNKDFRIFMNNVLKHRGYRFYQSSYDNDEKGTILSVNNDPWGTLITYLGYFFLFSGIILSIFNPKSYFHRLLKRIASASVITLLLTLALSFKAEGSVPSKIPRDIASSFSNIWVQGHEGRIKPFSTLAYEVIMKVTRSEGFSGQTPEQIILGMMVNPDQWQRTRMIALSDPQIEQRLGTGGSKAAFSDFFNNDGSYKFAEEIQTAYSKNPAHRNKFDNAVIKIDERLNVIYQLYNGDLFRFYPSLYPEETKWYTSNSVFSSAVGKDSVFIRTSFRKFVDALKNSNTIEAKQIISSIKNFQQLHGSALIPGKTKGRLEIMYNHINIFKNLTLWYIILGFVLLYFFFHSIFTGKPLKDKAARWTVIALAAGFIAHCLGLIIRGYISAHMPWSNGYESMIYIAWAGMLAGLIFARKNPMVLGAAAILSGLTLFVAQMSWLNPEITNLVPVLKSYWLTIHVAIITASYGFLGVSAIIGILNLLMADFQNAKNSRRLGSSISQMTAINQASMILGLYFLTIGTFIGGIWANESWGRYWGWDPKETWSLITILVYSFITHMRWIPGFRGWFAINLGSFLGMLSVLMTYLGVNYYLSGLHSYGSGEGLQFPLALVIVFVLVGVIAFFAKKRGRVDEKIITGTEE